ncbi:MAG TPA: YdeI/OmpD-associated family protein [Candidatus Limnocylindrales bacterium]|nr:YdeI/OmpD-associated family protein [Candidatus Limnocylindrales bacterium]
MEISKTLYVKTRSEWRKWLEKNHDKAPGIWLVYYKKASGKPRIPYNEAVQEALCYGWIDSILKGIDDERLAQRYSPRQPKSNWSALNLERMKMLIKGKQMTPAGLKYYPGATEFKIPKDILKEIKKDKETWNNFQKFDESYQIIRIGFIEGARSRPEEFQKRLKYFLKKTKENKKFGMEA